MAAHTQAIDKQLQEMAMFRWEEFKKITGLDTSNFEICVKRRNGMSIRQIALSTKVSKSRVHRLCGICPEK